MIYNVTIFPAENVAEGNPLALSLEELVEMLTTFESRPSKEGSALWSPATFKDNYRLQTNTKEFCALVFDIDEEDVDLPDGLPSYVLHQTYRKRIRLVFPLKVAVSPARYLELYDRMASLLNLGDANDTTSRDTARAFYLPIKPADADLVGAWLPGSGLLDPSVVIGATKISVPQASVAQSESLDLSALIEATKARYKSGALRDEIVSFLSLKLVPEVGSRDTTINRVAFCLAQVDGALPWSKARPLFEAMVARMGNKVDPEGSDHWLAKAQRSYERGTAERARDLEYLTKARAAFAAHREADDWRAQLVAVRDRKGELVRYESSGHNAQLVLTNDSVFKTLRFNELTMQPELDAPEFQGTAANDLDTVIMNWLYSSDYRIKLTRGEVAAQMMLAARKRSYSPVRDYLVSLRGKWDSLSRIGLVLQEYCAAQGNFEHIARVSRKFFIGAVARAMAPGCQVDSALLLQGLQGVGKSSFLRAIADPWVGTVRLDPRNKDTVLIARSNWLVELAELQGYHQSELEGVKAYMTERVDQIRVPFARLPERFPRRCVFVGSTNSDTPLRDSTGNRRWWPVCVGRIKTAELSMVRDQLWAEALQAYEEGEAWHLQGDEAEIAESEAGVFQSEELEDLYAQQIHTWFISQSDPKPEVTVAEVLAKVFFTSASQTDHGLFVRVGKALRQLKFTRVRGSEAEGRRPYYVAPGFLYLLAQRNAEEKKILREKATEKKEEQRN